MVLTRRLMLAGLLGACAPGGRGTPQRPVAAPRPVANPRFEAWLRGFRARAAGRGIPAPVLDRALAGAGYLPEVVATAGKQTEFVRSLEDNIALAASDARIRQGRAMLRRYRALFARLEARFQVEAELLCAIWGHESIYGARRGTLPVISALASLAFAGQRAGFNEAQLIAALKIVAAGEVAPPAMLGSWAGAMGHMQFIPTTYLAYAVDFDVDGRRDIWGDDPTDALASAANFLHRSGWRHGEPWGIEVRAGDGRDMQGRPPPDYPGAALLAPLGTNGPAFRVFRNYRVLLRYNNAMSYAIGVGHLADRLAGGGPLQGRFPPDAEGLHLAQRKEIQTRLAALGFDPGSTDGVIGPQTVAAIRAFQAARGLTVDGRASKALLATLRRG